MPGQRYVLPTEDALTFVADRRFAFEHRDGQTLIWDDEWYDDGAPVAVLPGLLTLAEVELWAAGRKVGWEAGWAGGARYGFASCQSGIRALLGAASAHDVDTFLDAAKEARIRERSAI